MPRRERERPIYCEIIRDEPTTDAASVSVKPCMMCPDDRCLYARTTLDGKIQPGKAHLRVSLSATRDDRLDSHAHLACAHVICVGPHLPKAANRQAYFEDFERRELFMTFPGMDRLASDDERKALASYWSALIQANLGENYDAPADRLRFANYRRVKRMDGADAVDDGELLAALEAQADAEGAREDYM